MLLIATLSIGNSMVHIVIKENLTSLYFVQIVKTKRYLSVMVPLPGHMIFYSSATVYKSRNFQYKAHDLVCHRF